MANIQGLLLVGGPYHDGPGARAALTEALTAGSHLDLRVTDDLSVLAAPALASFDVIIIYTTGGQLTPAEEAGLCDFVASGRGCVGLHCATTSFRDSPRYQELIGSRFVSHPPFAEVEVTIVDASHPATAGLDTFRVPDELYVLDYDPAQVQVLATAALGDRVQPSTYVKAWGKGRVFYTALGHDQRCFVSPAFRRLVAQGLRWAVTGANGRAT